MGLIKLGNRDIKTRDSRRVTMTSDIKGTLKELSKVKRLLLDGVFLCKGRAVKEIKTAAKTAIKGAGIHDFHFHDLRQ